MPTLSPTFARLPAPDPQPLPQAEVLGIPLALCDYEQTMDWIDAMISSGRRGYMTAAAVHLVMVAQDDPDTRAAVLGASLAVPDGQPLVWALQALGHGAECSRVYGPELMVRYCRRSAQTGTRMYLYGGRDRGALVKLTLNLRRRCPGVRIVGGYSPPYRESSPDEDEWIAEQINRSEADVVWVGTGQPKQEKWMARMRPLLEAPMLIGVGAAFDIHAGLVAQAPQWMQGLGLEWSFRLAHEPRRLWRRYARYNPRFVAGFTRQYLEQRRV
jgi:N-acetylglucosaminyldiphosphoundecaprenol N-acetyl-beta-D-mannosaminyltransferase